MLYHEVVLDVDPTTISCAHGIHGTLARPNPGLAHLHSLHIISTQKYGNMLLGPVVQPLLRGFPVNTLQHLYCDVDQDLICSVTNQVNLKTALVMPSSMDSRPLWLRLKLLAQCTEVTMLATDFGISAREQVALERASGLERLNVSFGDGILRTRKHLTRWSMMELDTGHATRFQQLAALDLQKPNFAYLELTPENHMRNFDQPTPPVLRNLISLVLQACDMASLLFDELAKEGEHLSLEVLVVIVGQDSPHDFSAALDKLLSSFSDLRTLIVDAQADFLPGAQAVVKHAATLKELYLGRDGCVGVGHIVAYTRAICEACTGLEQLSLSLRRLQPGNLMFAEVFGSVFPFAKDEDSTTGYPCQDFILCLSSISKLHTW